VRWDRSFALSRGGNSAVTITDRFELSEAVPVTLSLMTPREPVVTTPGELTLPGDTDVRVSYDASQLDATVETIEVTDERLLPVWGERVYRVLLSSRGPVAEGDWMVRFST